MLPVMLMLFMLLSWMMLMRLLLRWLWGWLRLRLLLMLVRLAVLRRVGMEWRKGVIAGGGGGVIVVVHVQVNLRRGHVVWRKGSEAAKRHVSKDFVSFVQHTNEHGTTNIQIVARGLWLARCLSSRVE